MEASRVAYVADGDEEGNKLERVLKSAGVDPTYIVRLKSKLTLEDLVDEAVYLDAVNEELRRSHGEDVQISALPSGPRARTVKSSCDALGVDPPSKVNVAHRLVERAARRAIVDPARSADLAAMDKRFAKLLGLDR